jgi:hypothetical protein
MARERKSAATPSAGTAPQMVVAPMTGDNSFGDHSYLVENPITKPNARHVKADGPTYVFAGQAANLIKKHVIVPHAAALRTTTYPPKVEVKPIRRTRARTSQRGPIRNKRQLQVQVQALIRALEDAVAHHDKPVGDHPAPELYLTLELENSSKRNERSFGG